jgi:hypothetical protein
MLQLFQWGCNIRCNFDAKNTLDFNYLTVISGGEPSR